MKLVHHAQMLGICLHVPLVHCTFVALEAATDIGNVGGGWGGRAHDTVR